MNPLSMATAPNRLSSLPSDISGLLCSGQLEQQVQKSNISGIEDSALLKMIIHSNLKYPV
jgi:hypothetical protein